MPEPAVELAAVEKLAQALEARVARTVEELPTEAVALVRGGELAGAFCCRPFRAVFGERLLEAAEVDPIAAGIGAGTRSHLHPALGENVVDDPREISDPVVLFRRADVVGAGVDQLARRGEHGEHCATDVSHVNDRSPRTAVREKADLARREGPADEI